MVRRYRVGITIHGSTEEFRTGSLGNREALEIYYVLTNAKKPARVYGLEKGGKTRFLNRSSIERMARRLGIIE